MKQIIRFWIALAVIAALLIASGAQAATSFWVTRSTSGAMEAGDAISVATGANFTLGVWCNTTDEHSLFDILLGYDKSTATTYGTAAASGVYGYITRVSTTAEVKAPILSDYSSGQLTAAATARQASNTDIGGRPYGLQVSGNLDTGTWTGPETQPFKLFEVTLNNTDIAMGDHYHVVISNAGSGTSFTSALKKGVTVYRAGYSLQVNNVVPEPSGILALVVGAMGLAGFAIRRRR